MNALWQDLRFGLRTLRRSPLFTAVAVALLALGIGGITAGFSLLDTFFLRPLPYDAADRLVQLGRSDPGRGYTGLRFSLPNLLELRREATGGEDGPAEEVAAYNYTGKTLQGARGEPESLGVGRLTVNLLPMLGREPIMGRAFTTDEARPGEGKVVLLSHGLWDRRFGGDTAAVGRSVELNGEPHTVIGVMPPDFHFPYGGVKAWIPVTEDASVFGRDYRNFMPVVRLREGVDRETALRRLELLYQRAHTMDSDAEVTMGVTMVPLRDALIFMDDVLRPAFTVGLGAAGFVLLIVCANVAGLLLARSRRRDRELAIRSALGAGRSRLVRQLLTETGILAACGGALGILFAWWELELIHGWIPDDLFRVGEIGLDSGSVLVTLLVVVAAALVTGIVPALRTSGTANLRSVLHGGSRATEGGRGVGRGYSAFVAAQFALALVLVTGSTVMVRSFTGMRRAEPGFTVERILTLSWRLASHEYEGEESLRNFQREALPAVASAPGVRSAALVNPLPLNFETYSVEFRIPGDTPESERRLSAGLHVVSPGYFRTMEIPLLRGRGFADSDDEASTPVVVVSRELESRFWPEDGAIGREILLGRGEGAERATVIGVVADTKLMFTSDPPRPVLYRSMLQHPVRRGFLVAGTRERAEASAGPVREALRRVDPALPISSVRSMEQVVSESLAPWSGATAGLAVMGGEALFLAVLGLYGIVAFTVTSRRREVGIRSALGATRRQVVGLFIRRAGRQVAVGLLLGLAGAVVLTRALAGLLYEVEPMDPLSLGMAVVLSAGAALVASWLPALRAVRVDPMIVLREE